MLSKLLKKAKFSLSLKNNIFVINIFVKFVFSKKATKFDKIFTVDLTLTTNCQIDGEDFLNFCGLLRKHELQTSTFKPLYFLKWGPIFDDFYLTDRQTKRLFYGLVFGPKGRPGRMCNIVRQKWGHTNAHIHVCKAK